MRWFRVTRARIDPEIREIFEQRGADTLRAVLPLDNLTMSKPDGTLLNVYQLRGPMLLWLKEQYDRAERKETWLITMEVAITFFVAAEVLMSVLDLICKYSK